MNMNDYQQAASTTNIYPLGQAGYYAMALGLCGESGEFADKLKKIIRDKEGHFAPENQAQLVQELGDALWYLSQLALWLNVNLSDLAQLNLDKLASREARGKIRGSGDDR